MRYAGTGFELDVDCSGKRTGCRACEMACSALSTAKPRHRSVNPARSRIRLVTDGCRRGTSAGDRCHHHRVLESDSDGCPSTGALQSLQVSGHATLGRVAARP